MDNIVNKYSTTNYEAHETDAEIARICLECDLPDCNPGTCRRYKRLYRELKTGEKQLKPSRPSNIRLYSYAGKTMTLREWAICTGINLETLKSRLGRNNDFVQAITTPVANNGNTCYVEWEGKTIKLAILCDMYNISYDTVKGRLKDGWSLYRAITQPVQKRKPYKKRERTTNETK